MKKLILPVVLFIAGFPVARISLSQTASVLMRPQYIDVSHTSSRSAVLMELTNYPSDEARYRLYNGSTQYTCWDAANKLFVTSTTYSSGPLVPGSPSTSTVFWIAFRRGNNSSTHVTYRDRLGPLYSSNFREVSLPSAASMEVPDSISGTLVAENEQDLSEKYILLAFSGSLLVSASHSDPASDLFSILFPSGVEIDRVEVRKTDNNLVGYKEGRWSTTASIGTISLSIINRFVTERQAKVRLYPVPSSGILYLEAEQTFSRLVISDISGRPLSAISGMLPGTNTIDVSHLPQGIYFLRLISGNDSMVLRFIRL